MIRSTYSRSLSTGSTSSAASSENLPPRTLARVAREVRDLHRKPPEGVRLVVDAETGMPASLGELVAEIEGPTGTPYESRFFQLKLVLSPDFPNSPPRGYFLTKIYHPNVDQSSGAICVNTLKKDWSPSTSFNHILSVVRCLLIVPFPESSLNDEAGKLFMESYNEYARRARIMAGVHGKQQPFDKCSESDFNLVGKAGSSESGHSNTGYDQHGELSIMKRGSSLSDSSLSVNSLRANSISSVGISASSPSKKNSSTQRNGSLRVSGKNNKIGGQDKKSKKKGLKRL